MKYYIGVDLGTSAVKLLLMDQEGQVVNIKTLNYLLFICYNITPPTPLQERIQTQQTTTMRNTLCEFLELSRQSPRSHASMGFGSLLA